MTKQIEADLNALLALDQPKNIKDQLNAALEKLGEVDDFPEGLESEDYLTKEILRKIDVVHCARQSVRLALSGIRDENGGQLIEFANESLEGVPSLGVEPELIRGLARRLFEARNPKKGEVFGISGTKRNIEILIEVARICREEGVDFVMDVIDHDFDVVLLNNTDDENIKLLGKEKCSVYDGVNNLVNVISASNVTFNLDKRRQYGAALQPYLARIRGVEGAKGGKLEFSVAEIPTEQDA